MTTPPETQPVEALIEEIDGLFKRATPTPWVADLHVAEPGSDDDDRVHVIGAYGNYAKQCLVRELSTMQGNSTDRQHADAQLIARLVTSWPRLRTAALAKDGAGEELRERIIEKLIRLFDDEGREEFQRVIERGGSQDEASRRCHEVQHKAAGIYADEVLAFLPALTPTDQSKRIEELEGELDNARDLVRFWQELSRLNAHNADTYRQKLSDADARVASASAVMGQISGFEAACDAELDDRPGAGKTVFVETIMDEKLSVLTDTEEPERNYVIIKRGYYYRPNARGYTAHLAEAGRYTLEEAKSHANNEPPRVTYKHVSECETGQ